MNSIVDSLQLTKNTKNKVEVRIDYFYLAITFLVSETFQESITFDFKIQVWKFALKAGGHLLRLNLKAYLSVCTKLLNLFDKFQLY